MPLYSLVLCCAFCTKHLIVSSHCASALICYPSVILLSNWLRSTWLSPLTFYLSLFYPVLQLSVFVPSTTLCLSVPFLHFSALFPYLDRLLCTFITLFVCTHCIGHTLPEEYITLPHLFQSDSSLSGQIYQNLWNLVDFFFVYTVPLWRHSGRTHLPNLHLEYPESHWTNNQLD